MKNIFAILLIHISITAFSCGGGWEDPFYYSFFQNEQDSTQLHPYMFNQNNNHFYGRGEVINLNLEAWEKFFKSKYKTKDLEKVIYKINEDQLQRLHKLSNGVKASTDEKTSFTKFEKALVNNKHGDFLTYLIYARKCLVQATKYNSYSWYRDNTEERDSALMNNLIIEGKAFFQAIKNVELKQRFGFQLVRLAHYQKNYILGKELFEQYVKPIKNDSYIYFRAWEQYAGVLHSLGKKDTAGYIFSRVFDKLKDRRASCVNSFDFGRSSFEGVKALCKNKSELASLYAMRALTHSGSPEGELEYIIEADPNSPYVEWFYTQSIYNWETQFFEPIANWRKEGKESVFSNSYNKNLLDDLRDLAIRMQSEGSKKRRDFWKFNEAYIRFMQKDYDASELKLKEIKEKSMTYTIKKLRYAIKLLTLDSINIEAEKELYAELPAYKDDIKTLFQNVMRIKFFESNQLAKAYLINYEAYRLNNNLDLKMLDLLIEFKGKTAESEFEKTLQEKISYRGLYYGKGTYFLRRNNLNKALEFLSKSDDLSIDEDFADGSLFRNSIHHFFSVNYNVQSSNKEVPQEIMDYLHGNSRTNLTKTLIKIENLAKSKANSQPELSAKLYFSLGCAWNNMSPYGWHRPMQYSHSPKAGNCCNSYIYGVKGPEYFEEENWDFRQYMLQGGTYYNSGIASEYLLKALELTTNKELKAKIFFKLSEAELYQSYTADNNYYWGSRSDEMVDNKTREWYAELAKLGDTKYCQEVIKECSYFRNFIYQRGY